MKVRDVITWSCAINCQDIRQSTNRDNAPLQHVPSYGLGNVLRELIDASDSRME